MTLQFSISAVKAEPHSHHTIFKTIQIDKFSDIAQYVIASKDDLPLIRWMPAVLSNEYRSKENYAFNQFICLDYDNGNPTLSWMACRIKQLGFMHFLGTTHHHQKEKNGKICDRFRLILPLKRPMPDSDLRYNWVMKKMLTKWGKADDQAINKTRMFKPCSEIISISDGKLFDYEEPPSDEEIEESERKRIERLRPKRFIKTARIPKGLKERIKKPISNGHRACDCHDIAYALSHWGYSFAETVAIVSSIPMKFGDGFDHKEMMRNITNGWEGK